MKNKRVVLINSYCDNQEKINILETNINKIKSNSLDVILLSPIELPTKIINLCDFYFQTKENPVTIWPNKTMFEFWNFCMDNIKYELYLGKPDYGWAALYQMKKLSQIGLTFDYEYYFHIIYDTIIDDFLLNVFLTDDNCILFPSYKGFEVGSYFLGFNKKSLKIFENLITEEVYYKNHDVVETLLTTMSKVLPCKIENYMTEDQIYYYSNQDLFNYSNFNSFKFFIHKRTLSDDVAKIFFYDMLNPCVININVNNTTIEKTIRNHMLVDLGLHHDAVNKLSITHNGVEQNLILQYNNISHNKITITENVNCNNL
jgi:hypothetical protein